MTSPPDYRMAFSRLMLVVAVALLGWIIPFAIANYQLDDCTKALHVRLDDIKAKIDAARTAPPQQR